MKIIWVADKYLDVSIDSVTWIQTCRELMNQGENIHLISGFKREKKSFGLNGNITYLPSIKKRVLGYATFSLSLIFYLTGYLFFRRPDVLLVHPFTVIGLIPMAILRKLGLLKTRFVCDVRTIPVESSGVFGRVNEMLFRVCMKCAALLFDGFTAITPFMRQVLSMEYNIPISSVGVWASGVSTELFNPDHFREDEKQDQKRAMNIEKKFVVMYHGVLSFNRGLSETVHAFRLIKQDYPDIALVLIGKGASSSYLKKMVSKYGLKDSVYIKESIPFDMVPSVIAVADVGIIPLPAILWWRVSSPIKLMEYLSMEKPVIVTDIEAHQEVLKDVPCGYFIPSHDPEHIAEGIIKVYKERKKAKISAKKGRDLVQRRFTWEKQSKHLAEYLQQLVKDETVNLTLP